jgi:hypothetical protein
LKQFLPFLTDDQGRSLSVENEVVVTSSIPDPLNNSPEGWENNTLQWARNKEFYGIIKSYTTSLKFYLQGAKILRNAFYKLGMETVLFFIWLKQNVTFGAGMKYEGWYKGEPDFSTFKDEWDGVEISITEGGFFKDLQANKTVVYEVPFTDSDFVYMDGMNLYQKLIYEDITDLDVSIKNYTQNFLGPYSLTTQEGSSVGFYLGNESLAPAPSVYTDKIASDNIILQNLLPDAVDITISGRISFKCTKMTSSPAWAIKFRYLTSTLDIGHQNDYQIISTPAMVIGTTYFQDFSILITLQPNETLLREGIFFGGVGVDATIQFNEESKSNIAFKTRSPSNLVPVFRAFDYGQKLVTNMSQQATFKSPLLEPDFNLMVTCGDALRNIEGAVLKGHFSDYFKSIDAVKCAALDIVDNVPTLTSRYDKYNRDSVIAQLGECSNWTLEPANDYVYDTVESGFPSKSSQSDNDVNGKYSFNNTYLWKIGVTRRNKNQYECKAAYYADPYDIELIRVNFANKDTTTANTDNSIFFLDCEPKMDLSFSGTIKYDSVANTIELIGDLTAIKEFIAAGIKLRVTSSSIVTDFTILNQVISTTSGLLVVGKTYIINTLQSGDDFTNVGYVSDGVDFVATGTTPTNWTNETEVINKTDSQSGVILLSDTDAVLKVEQYVPNTSTVTGTITWTNLYQLRRKTYAAINGIINDGTVFNIELSPRRCLQNHLRWIRSSCDHLDMAYLVFQTTDKNKDLQTIDADGDVITESANIQIGSMGEKVYLPYLFKMEVKSPQNLLELMNANHDGVFEYTKEGLEMDGFPVEIATNDATLETQTYQLLASANNNLELLINNR